MSTDQEPLVPRPDTYDDTFVTIDGATSTLTLKHYLLVKPTLKVHIPDLLYIRPASEVVKRIGLRPQGISLSGILWARDWHRGGAIVGPRSGYERSFVIKVKGHRLRNGFSVKDPEKFLQVLKHVCPGVTNAAMGAQEAEEIRTETGRELETAGEDVETNDL